MSWNDLKVEKPETSILAGVMETPPKPKAKPKKTAPVKRAKPEKLTRKVTSYLSESEFKELELKLDGRTQAGVIRRSIIDWMKTH